MSVRRRARNDKSESARATAGRGVRRGFTLIELLVVIGIIALLIAIVSVVGGRVIAGSKATMVQDTIKAMDLVYAGYMADRDLRPDPGVPDPRNSEYILPVADARNMSSGDDEMINSIGLFIYQMEREGQPVQAALTGLNPRLVTFFAEDPNAPMVGPTTSTARPDFSKLPQLRTVMDPWGRPLRYVHPAYSGSLFDATFDAAERRGVYAPSPDPSRPYALRIVLTEVPDAQLPIQQIRRNGGEAATGARPGAPVLADSDGGICPKYGGVAYFYSAGPDGDPSTREDNVYVDANRPTFPR